MCRRAADSPSLPPSTAPPTRASLALPGDGCMQSLPLPLASFREVFTVNTRTHPLKGERRQTPSNFALDRQLQIVPMYCGGVELDQLAFLPYFEEICGKPIMWTSGGVEFLDPPFPPSVPMLVILPYAPQLRSLFSIH